MTHIVKMKPISTGQPIKIQPKYRSPLIIVKLFASKHKVARMHPGTEHQRYTATVDLKQTKLYRNCGATEKRRHSKPPTTKEYEAAGSKLRR